LLTFVIEGRGGVELLSPFNQGGLLGGSCLEIKMRLSVPDRQEMA
jgi:hypothetical protein